VCVCYYTILRATSNYQLAPCHTVSYFWLFLWWIEIEIGNVFLDVFVKLSGQSVVTVAIIAVSVVVVTMLEGIHDLSDVQFVKFLQELQGVVFRRLDRVGALVLDDQYKLGLRVGHISIDPGLLEGKQEAHKICVIAVARLFLPVRRFRELLQPIEGRLYNKPAPGGGRYGCLLAVVVAIARGQGFWCQTEQDSFVVIVVVIAIAAIVALVFVVVFREEFPHVEGQIVLTDNG